MRFATSIIVLLALAVPRAARAVPVSLAEEDSTLFEEEEGGVQLWTVVEQRHEAIYAKQMEAMRCYARLHGYRFRTLRRDAYGDACTRRDIFFAKHCIVAKTLADEPDGTVVVVLDADVTPANDEVPIERFLDGSDLIFYERGQDLPTGDYELAAGNYIVRNGDFARSFLNLWSLYDYPMPKGFSSSDNGAIHVVMARALGAPNAEECAAGYRALSGTNLNLDPMYFPWVKLCRKFVQAGHHVVAGGLPPYPMDESFRRNLPHPAGRITIASTWRAFVVDGSLARPAAWDQSGRSPTGDWVHPALFHGLKDSSQFTATAEHCALVQLHDH